jgi:hypothetical protein
MRRVSRSRRGRNIAGAACALILLAAAGARASDHLDTPSVIAEPGADIGDFYAWTAPDGRRLNLVMTIVGQSFSDRLDYMFHIESGPHFGDTRETVAIVCRFAAAGNVSCRAGEVDRAEGDPSDPAGLVGENGHFRVFAGLRDDPFFNNVRGTRAAYQVAQQAIEGGAPFDAARCPGFDPATSRAIFAQWRQTDGGPGRNFLAGWVTAAIVVSVDLDIVARGGPILGAWASTRSADRQIDRAGRPLTGNALLGTLDPEVGTRMKEAYNETIPADGEQFVAEIASNLGLYDGFDGICGNQILAGPAVSGDRYLPLARLLADDRLWVNSASGICTQLFAVELAARAGRGALAGDCGGRTPNYKAVTVYRSLLSDATNDSLDDGVDRDEQEHSAAYFPFLAPPVTPALEAGR